MMLPDSIASELTVIELPFISPGVVEVQWLVVTAEGVTACVVERMDH